MSMHDCKTGLLSLGWGDSRVHALADMSLVLVDIGRTDRVVACAVLLLIARTSCSPAAKTTDSQARHSNRQQGRQQSDNVHMPHVFLFSLKLMR